MVGFCRMAILGVAVLGGGFISSGGFADARAGEANQGGAEAKAGEPAIELTAEEKAERESRRACKAAICGALHSGKAGGTDISCSVIKSWRKSQIEKIAGKAHMSWPYGRVRCTSDLRLSHDDLAKALADEKHLTKLKPHSVTCTVEGEKTDAAKITFEFAPEITFEKGKAVKARLNWGKIEAPKLVKAAMWAATATDNTLNVLQQSIIDDVNDFTSNKCDEIKADWAGK